MKRITKRDRATAFYPQHRKRGLVKMRNKAIFRLAEYEDTGLTPGDVKDLQALCGEKGLAEYVDLIVQAKRQMAKANEQSIEQDEWIEQLEARLAACQRERDAAGADIKYLVFACADDPCDLCFEVCENYDGICVRGVASGFTDKCHGYGWRGPQGENHDRI